jgi:hypothetical protein
MAKPMGAFHRFSLSNTSTQHRSVMYFANNRRSVTIWRNFKPWTHFSKNKRLMYSSKDMLLNTEHTVRIQQVRCTSADSPQRTGSQINTMPRWDHRKLWIALLIELVHKVKSVHCAANTYSHKLCTGYCSKLTLHTWQLTSHRSLRHFTLSVWTSVTRTSTLEKIGRLIPFAALTQKWTLLTTTIHRCQTIYSACT